MSLKVAYTAFMAVLVPVYWHHYGPTNFLYFCDVALFLTLAGPGRWALGGDTERRLAEGRRGRKLSSHPSVEEPVDRPGAPAGRTA